ncbi:MAG: ABC transporter permease [Saprospiraceae bacterium]
MPLSNHHEMPDPPKWANRFLEWYCSPDQIDEIQGDLYEVFQSDVKNRGIRYARLKFIRDVLLFFRPSSFKKEQPVYPNKTIMFNYYLKTTFRNLFKNSAYSAINIFGLALGLAACLLVFSYTQRESNYDTMHADLDQLYRVNQTAIWDPEGGVMSSTAPPLAALLKAKYPEIEASTRINTPGGRIVRYKPSNQQVLAFNEEDILAADSNFFDFFAFTLKEGDARTALQGVGKVILSAEAAEKYFGEEQAIGKTLEFGDERMAVEVTGVTNPQPENLHFHFDFLLSMPTNPNVEKFDWSYIWTQMVTYVKLRPGVDVDAFETKLEAIADTYVQPSFSRLGMDYKDFVGNKGGWNFYLQPVRDIHLKSVDIGNRIGPIGDMAIINLLRFVALLILLIAMLNFINLSTARASTRAKEIGVKKTMGAFRYTLVGQFLMESIIITALATLLALGMVTILQTIIQYFSGIFISTAFIFNKAFLLILLLIPIGIGVLAGLYPAFYLSAYKPLQVLKGNLSGGIKSGALRNVLVTAQFTISIALMAGTLLIHQQLQFLNKKDLGFNEENIIVINHAEKLGNKLPSFRNEIKDIPGVVNASLAMDMPGRGTFEDIFSREGSDLKLPISQNKIDEYYFETMGLSLSAGRAFEKNRPSDKNGLIINETTAKLFAWEDGEAIGKSILYPDYPGELTVIGVVKDFHFQSLRENITPMMFFNIESDMWGDQRVLTLKYAQKDEQQLLSQLETTWKEMALDVPFEYSYFDQELAQLYEQERSLSGLISVFTSFSLFIAIIGLVGLLAFSAEQKRKEIGIRKVLGASILQVFLMLNQQYLKLFLLALVLAVPLSWQSMQQWLNSFAYSININVFVYVIAGLLVVILSFISVSYLSLKAASTNPATVLKDE